MAKAWDNKGGYCDWKRCGIGYEAVILAGDRWRRAVIGARAVVTKDVPPYTIT